MFTPRPIKFRSLLSIMAFGIMLLLNADAYGETANVEIGNKPTTTITKVIYKESHVDTGAPGYPTKAAVELTIDPSLLKDFKVFISSLMQQTRYQGVSLQKLVEMKNAKDPAEYLAFMKTHPQTPEPKGKSDYESFDFYSGQTCVYSITLFGDHQGAKFAEMLALARKHTQASIDTQLKRYRRGGPVMPLLNYKIH